MEQEILKKLEEHNDHVLKSLEEMTSILSMLSEMTNKLGKEVSHLKQKANGKKKITTTSA